MSSCLEQHSALQPSKPHRPPYLSSEQEKSRASFNGAVAVFSMCRQSRDAQVKKLKSEEECVNGRGVSLILSESALPESY